MRAKRNQQENSQSSGHVEPPAQTAEAREQQLIYLATNRVEQRLRDGTASPSEIVHYLKLGSTKERREREKLEEEIKLLRAKTEELKAAKQIEELYKDAILKFSLYNGESVEGMDNDTDPNLYRTD